MGQLAQRFGLDQWKANDPSAIVARLDTLLAAANQLKEFLDWRDQRSRVASVGVDALLQRVEELDIGPTAYPRVFAALIASARSAEACRSEHALSRASGMRLEARRREFVERDRRKLDQDRVALKSALLPAAPPSGNRRGARSTWTEMSLIANEFGKQKRFCPVRDLIQRAGRAIQEMKPCFMMSPLSLAKFLPAASMEFDLLLIDEASQMRPEDALGALLRAKQVVVVGDEQQLPPTDFFSRTGTDGMPDVDDDAFADEPDESILEACRKSFGKMRFLRWHYRSRCESLIAFSNAEFYRNELITFPKATPLSFSVDLRRVAGTYQASRNPAEAQAVVADAVRLMLQQDDADDADLVTIGIVAVNTQQRDLIKEELRLAATRDDRIARYRERVAALGEEFFVKNLENVQGDERDVILISLTYGPQPGMTSPHQRFGPINGEHGGRRLNVLFSRARTRIILFSSMSSEQIVGDPSKAAGPRILKRYLEYAEAGGQAVAETRGGEADSDFEIDVAQRLRRAGHVVDTQVGVSGYRIDLGVRNPDQPGAYLAGVECDGARYHSSKSARDRDRLRQDCLKAKGWDLLRVWSTDWFDNPDAQTEKLLDQLQALRVRAASRLMEDELARARRAAQSSIDTDTATETQCPDVEPLLSDGQAQSPELHQNVSSNDPGPEQVAPSQPAGGVDWPLRRPAAGPIHSLLSNTPTSTFLAAKVSDCGIDPNPSRFYEPAYISALRRMVSHVIKVEGPLYQDQLVTRIARAHGFMRNGSQIVDRVCDAVERSFACTQEADGRIVYWPEDADTGKLVPLRAAVTSQERDHNAIPLAELASLAAHIIARGSDDEATIHAMKDFFGLAKLREATRKRFAGAIELARARAPEPDQVREDIAAPR